MEFIAITLTMDGDVLLPREEYLDLDNPGLGYFIGTHEICNGCVDALDCNRNQKALICRKCNLRIPFPNWIKSYRQLADWFMKRHPYR